MNAFQRQFTRLAQEAGLAAFEASSAAAVTIALRWPILASTVTNPSQEATEEATAAVQEKLEAFCEGSMAAALEWQRACIGFAFRGWTPHGLLESAAAIHRAASSPANRKVRSNAKRLLKKGAVSRRAKAKSL